MTVTTEDGGRTNMFAREPQNDISKTDAERYGYETYAERAEKLNGRTAMLGFVAAVISYATTGSIFLWSIRHLMTELLTYYVIVSVVFIGAPGVFFFHRIHACPSKHEGSHGRIQRS